MRRRPGEVSRMDLVYIILMAVLSIASFWLVILFERLRRGNGGQ